MAERVATGEVFIGVNDTDTLASLRKIEAEFDRTMSKIDRKEATATLDADTTQLKKDIAEGEALLKKFEKERATASNQQASALTKKINKQKESLDLDRKALAAAEEELKNAKAQNRERDFTEKRLAAIQKREEQIERVRRSAAKAQQKRDRDEMRMRETLERQRTRELNLAERQAYQMERERRGVANLDYQYSKLNDKLEKLAATKRRARGDEAKFRVELEERAVVEKMEAIRAKVWAVAHRNPIEIPVKVSRSHDWGRELRYEFERAGGHMATLASAVGLRTGRRLGQMVTNGTRDTLDRGLSGVAKDAGRKMGTALGGAAMSGLRRIGHAAEGLADVTLRLGPFTTTIRKAIVGLALLGPTILDLVGAAGSLVGSLGAATLGVGALGAAVAGGAIPSFLGMGLVIRGVVKQFSAVMTAQKAYDAAIQKGNTDLAKDKLKELQATMGNVSAETAKQFTLMGKLSDQWNKLTKPATAAVFTTMGEGIKTANSLLPMFAKNTNEVTEVASKGINKWLAALRSNQGAHILDNMMDNFRESLGPVLDGLGNLVGYLGKVGSIASNQLPGLARTFRDWAETVNSVSMSELRGKVEGVIDSARNMGRFFLSAGRLIKSFFAGGVSAGDGLIKTMTHAMNVWRHGFETPEGRADLEQFFQRSADGAVALWHALAPITSSFVQWAENMAPVAQAFLSGAGAIGRFVNALLDLGPLRGWVSSFATTLGALWAIGKINAAAGAIRGFIEALFGMKAAEAAAVVETEALTAAELEQAAASRTAAGSAGLGGLSAALSGASGRLAMFASRMTVAAAVAYAGFESFKAGIPVGHDLADSMSTQVDVMGDLKDAVNEGSDEMLKWARGSDTAKEAFDEMFGKGAADSLDTTTRMIHGYGKGLKDVVADLVKSGKLNKNLRVRMFLSTQGTDQLKQLSRQADQLGGSKQVINILANSNSAEQAIKRLKALIHDFESGKHSVALSANNSKAMAAFKQVDSEGDKAEKPRTVPISSPDSPRVIKGLHDIGDWRTDPKSVQVRYDDGGTLSYLDSIKTAQAAIERVINIVTHYSHTGDPPRNASGRRATTPQDSLVGEGSDMKGATEYIVSSKTGAVTRVDQPTMMALGPHDAVIPTEPRYRDRGRSIFKEVAASLGVGAHAAGWDPVYGDQIPPAGYYDSPQQKRALRAINLMEGRKTGKARKLWNSLNDETRLHYMQTMKLVVPKGLSMSEDGSITRLAAGRSAAGGAVKQIAQALGIAMFARGRSAAKPKDTEPKTHTNPHFGAGFLGQGDFSTGGLSDSDSAFEPGHTIDRDAVFKPSKKKGKILTSENGWAGYINYLEDMQQNWSREVEIRESQVKEPENTIVRDPASDYTYVDPITGETTPIKAYKANDDQIKPYKQQLQSVLDAMGTLLDIIRELVRAIPMAIKANKQEAGWRVHHSNHLGKHIDHLQGKHYGKSKAQQAKKQKDAQTIQKLQSEKADNDAALSALRQDQGTLNDQMVDAGFSFRETQIAKQDLQIEKDNADPNALKEAQEAMTDQLPEAGSSGGSGSGGTGGSDGISYGQQAALADTEKGSILQQYGGNFAALGSNLGGVAAAVSGVGQSMRRNAAALTAPMGGPASAGGGVSAVTGLSAGSTAIQSSNAASDAVMASGAPSAPAGGVAAAAPAAPERNVTINNTFATVPPDPHTWSQGVAFEIAAVG